MNILINDKVVEFNKNDFPMLINGQAFINSGTSFFSVSLMTKLVQSGEKIIFFTGFEPAKELFREQIGNNNNNNDNVIIIASGDEDNFINKLDEIKDIDERIILFKNIEEYSIKLFNKLKDKKLIIFSGDIDKCIFKELLLKKDFKNKIYFSYPESFNIPNKIELPQYSGHIIGNNNGTIRLDFN
jgi:hypothetical protein